MDKNLPFVNVDIIDNAYNDRVLPFLGKIDNGQFFKWFLVFAWKIAAFAFLLGGVYLTIYGLLGDDGYIKMNLLNDTLTGGQKVGASIGLIIGIVLSLVCSWFLYSNTKKRSDELEEQEYVDLMHFIFLTMLPRTLTLMGEIAFALIMYAGVLQIIAGLDGYTSYAPLIQLIGPFIQLPFVDFFSSWVPYSMEGNYDFFSESLKMGVVGICASFLVLIVYYISREIYKYALKFIVSALTIIPKFEIRIATRVRTED